MMIDKIRIPPMIFSKTELKEVSSPPTMEIMIKIGAMAISWARRILETFCPIFFFISVLSSSSLKMTA
jgi:hypothetical protein